MKKQENKTTGTVTTFKLNVETTNDVDLEETKPFSLVFIIEDYNYIRGLMGLKSIQGNLSYGLKSAFLDGLELLKKENPLVTYDSLERRFYRGGKQKEKVQTYATSVVITIRDINWIDNYILQERKGNEFFSKPDFIENVVNQLRNKYGKKL